MTHAWQMGEATTEAPPMTMLPMPGIPSHRRPLASLARRRRAGGAARLSDHALACVFAGRAHRRDLQRGVPRGAGPGRGGHAALGSPDAPLSQREAASGHLHRGCLRRRAVAHGPSKSSPLPLFPVLARAWPKCFFWSVHNKLRAWRHVRSRPSTPRCLPLLRRPRRPSSASNCSTRRERQRGARPPSPLPLLAWGACVEAARAGTRPLTAPRRHHQVAACHAGRRDAARRRGVSLERQRRELPQGGAREGHQVPHVRECSFADLRPPG